MKITRQLIIEKLKDTLELDPNVNALWLEGADGTGSTDKYSDLDFVLDVNDGKEKKILKKIHTALSKLSPFDLVSAIEQKNPKMLDQVLHLKNSSEYLLIDINIQSHSRKFKFSKEMKHETPVAIFDKKKLLIFILLTM